jgi:hypothetical protein
MVIYKTEVWMPDSGLSDWVIHLALDENDPDKMSVIELSYSDELNAPVGVLITEDTNGLAYYDDMEYELLRYDAEAEVQAGMFTVRPSLYPTIKLTVLVEQKQYHISIEIKREACHEDHTEDDTDIQPE